MRPPHALPRSRPRAGSAPLEGGCRHGRRSWRSAPGSSPSSVFVPRRDRYRPLGRVPEREARDPEGRRLLLDAAGIGEHEPCSRLQTEEVEVAEGLDQQHGLGRDRPRRDRRCGRECGGARERRRGRVRPSSSSPPIVSREERRVVDERRAVERDEGVVALAQAETPPRARVRPRVGRCARSESIIVFPTRWTVSGSIPSRREVVERVLASASGARTRRRPSACGCAPPASCGRSS